MTDDIPAMVAGVYAISSLDDEAQLRSLEELITRFFRSSRTAEESAAWFRLFERFPEDDAYEMFWTILQGFEAIAGTEALVVESVRRCPSHFPVQMLNRMLNAGKTHMEGASLLDLLEAVAANPNCTHGVREDAQEFVAYQRGRS